MKSTLMNILLVILIVLLYDVIRHARNFLFIKKIMFLEELLNSRLYCRFNLLRPTVEINGKYKGRTIKFISNPYIFSRNNEFRLKSSKLPKQKRLILIYPRLAENAYQVGDNLLYCVFESLTSQLTRLGKSGVRAILDELLCIAEKVEHGKIEGGN